MLGRYLLAALVAASLVLHISRPASAFDSERAFARGSWLLSAEGGYGWQADIGSDRPFTGLEFANVGVRVGVLPWGPAGSGLLRGALEVGLEPLYQRYVEPVDAFYGGLAAVLRYHFLPFGRLVPYVELAGAAGGTNLNVPEIDSTFSFLLFGGGGVSYVIGDRLALYAGYRFQHVSNARTSSPNYGINSNTGVLGVTYFFK
jgi:opacity protein-like surface antigen